MAKCPVCNNDLVGKDEEIDDMIIEVLYCKKCKTTYDFDEIYYLNTIERKILEIINKNGTTSISELLEILKIDKSAITGGLKKLGNLGKIRKVVTEGKIFFAEPMEHIIIPNWLDIISEILDLES